MKEINISKKWQKELIFLTMVMLSSQIYLDIFISEFRVSIGIVVFSIFIVIFNDLNKFKMSLLSGIAVYFFRLIVFFIEYKTLDKMIVGYFPEIFFYLAYGLMFCYFYNKFRKDLAYLFVTLCISDFLANGIELQIHKIMGTLINWDGVFQTIILVAFIRSAMSTIGFVLMKRYKLLLIKEQHEERYKRLIGLVSLLKSEMYWMEKNKQKVEEVMSKAYKLYSDISDDKEKETWENKALEISTDVHEIKKEYNLVNRGFFEIIENKFTVVSMKSDDIFKILKEGIENEILNRKLKIELIINSKVSFETEYHYDLVSVLRNLFMNALDGIEESKRNEKLYFLKLDVYLDKSNYVFRVKDTGIGIPKEEIKFIFMPRYSTKIDYKTGSVNRGLGLSIVQNIVEEKLKGSIRVFSKIENETIFEVLIPNNILEV
jgi:two-component system sensor histidine kinase YcbA